MRFDFITIFPEYFEPLKLSLFGKAQETEKMAVGVHNLRQWASGAHLSVDDTPLGGGAGMVMRADIWGQAIDETIDPQAKRVVLAIPTPAGELLEQRRVEDLTGVDQIIVACGRYEGIDARVAQYYREQGPKNLEVLEFSLGDYVLSGGEVAGLVLAESVGRLLEDVVGNPESLVEESHSELGILEYPVYTRPRYWRELGVPAVLLGGNHAEISRWRRTQALQRTALTRPDLLDKIPVAKLDSTDKEVVAQAGWLLCPEVAPVTYRLATDEDLLQVAKLAGETFPLACPPHVSAASVQEFVQKHLNVHEFQRLIHEQNGQIMVAELGENSPTKSSDKSAKFVAYTLILPEPEEELPGCPPPAAYLSKCYTEAAYHGSGVSGALLEITVKNALETYATSAIVLGTHINNKRAQKFYKRHGFRQVGRRIFLVGETENLDVVMVREITD